MEDRKWPGDPEWIEHDKRIKEIDRKHRRRAFKGFFIFVAAAAFLFWCFIL